MDQLDLAEDEDVADAQHNTMANENQNENNDVEVEALWQGMEGDGEDRCPS